VDRSRSENHPQSARDSAFVLIGHFFLYRRRACRLGDGRHVALSVGLRFWQEARADSAAEKLKAMIHVTATVVRDGAAKEIPLRDLVPGDIIKLAAGDMIPGDVRLLSSKDVFVTQGSLTGESLPVEKFHDPETKGGVFPD